jgi:hypothetical protein
VDFKEEMNTCELYFKKNWAKNNLNETFNRLPCAPPPSKSKVQRMAFVTTLTLGPQPKLRQNK